MNELAIHLPRLIEENFDATKRSLLQDSQSKLADQGPKHLEVFFAALPRQFGKALLKCAMVVPGQIDFRSWRHCDLAAAALLQHQSTALVQVLHAQGDAEERRMLLKVLTLFPVCDLSAQLLEAAHRQNDEEIFKAAYADTNLPASCLDEDAFARGLLKAAFLDLPLIRIYGAEQRARPELSTMLQDFMTEREAAGRKIWAGSLELAAHAPAAGTRARILGDLWHGEDLRRFHAVRGAGILLKRAADAELRSELEARSTRERAPFVTDEINRILKS